MDLRVSSFSSKKYENGLRTKWTEYFGPFTPKQEPKTAATTDAPLRGDLNHGLRSSDGWPWTDEHVQNHPSLIDRMTLDR